MRAGSEENEEERHGGWRHQRESGRKNGINTQSSADGGAEMRCGKESKNIGRKKKKDGIEPRRELTWR